MSKYRKEEKPAIFKHRHCTVCGAPVSMSEKYCGPKCEDEYKKASRRRTYTFIATLAVFPVLLAILMFLRPSA